MITRWLLQFQGRHAPSFAFCPVGEPAVAYDAFMETSPAVACRHGRCRRHPETKISKLHPRNPVLVQGARQGDPAVAQWCLFRNEFERESAVAAVYQYVRQLSGREYVSRKPRAPKCASDGQSNRTFRTCAQRASADGHVST
jgi:hypothetical protein